MPDGRFTLNFYILGIIRHFKNSFVRIAYLPYDHCCNLNRVTDLIIHFELGRFKVVFAKRYSSFPVQWIYKQQSIFFDRPYILTKESTNIGLVGIDDRKSFKKKNSCYNHEY